MARTKLSRPERHRRLVEAYQKGSDEALDQLVEELSRLVRFYANRRAFQRYLESLTREDLFIEGVTGLIEAARRYDNRSGASFAHYAGIWIRSRIDNAIMNDGIIRIPGSARNKIGQLRQIEEEYYRTNFEKPSINDLAVSSGIPEKEVRLLLGAVRQVRSTEEPVRVGNAIESGNVVSLGDILEDTTALLMLDRAELVACLIPVLNELAEREKLILCRRFGLGETTPETYRRVGNEFGVSPERIRQIESRSLNKLRHPYRSDRLPRPPFD